MSYELTKNFEKELSKFFQWAHHHYIVENDLNQYVKWNKKMLVDFNETPRKKLDGYLKHVFKIYIIKDKKTKEVIDSYIDMISQFKNQKETQKKSKKCSKNVSTEDSIEDSFEESTQSSFESSFENSTEDYVESSFENSTEDYVESSFENSTQDSIESSFEDSIKSSFEDFTEDSIESSIESSFEDFTEDSIESSIESSFEDFTEDSIESSIESSFEDSINQDYIEDSDIEDFICTRQSITGIIINNNLDTSGTWWLDNLIYNTTHLVETFGKPVFTGKENDKHRYEWKFTYKKHIYTIYDWKFKNNTFCDILDCDWFLGGDSNDHTEEIINILDHAIIASKTQTK